MQQCCVASLIMQESWGPSCSGATNAAAAQHKFSLLALPCRPACCCCNGCWPCSLNCLLRFLHDASLQQGTQPLLHHLSFCLCLLQTCLLPPHRVLPLLRSSSRELLWQYLHHLVAGQGSTDAAVHTELALVLVKEASDLDPQQATPQAMPQLPEEADCDSSAQPGAPEHQQENSAPAGAADGVRVGAGGEGAADPRQLLQQHLEASSLYDAAAVMDQLRFSTLYQERVILHRKVAFFLCFLFEGFACRHIGTALKCHHQTNLEFPRCPTLEHPAQLTSASGADCRQLRLPAIRLQSASELHA